MSNKNAFLVIFATVSSLLITLPVKSGPLLGELNKLVEAVKNDTDIRNQVIATGREKALFCANCHGKDGNSIKPLVPNLAAQNPVYLLQQIDNFATGKRQDYTTVMQQLSRNMTDKEKIALAVYYANVPLKPNKMNITEDDYASGQTIYQSKCAGCHGTSGAGKETFARIGGQQPEYLKQVLAKFRDVDDSRKSPVMSAIVKNYSDKEIAAIAAYVGRLKP